MVRRPVVPGQTQYSRTFQFDSRAGTLEVENSDGCVSAVSASGRGLGPGTYTLLVRLQRTWREVGVIPIMKVKISSNNDVTYQAYEGVLEHAAPRGHPSPRHELPAMTVIRPSSQACCSSVSNCSVLAALGYLVARVALRQTDDRLALAQGLVIGPSIWGSPSTSSFTWSLDLVEPWPAGSSSSP